MTDVDVDEELGRGRPVEGVGRTKEVRGQEGVDLTQRGTEGPEGKGRDQYPLSGPHGDIIPVRRRRSTRRTKKGKEDPRAAVESGPRLD